MKQLLAASLAVLLLSSCLKQSIADAMIANENQSNGSPSVATMSYSVNGSTVTNTVQDPDSQSPTGYDLGCSKMLFPGANTPVYSLDCVSTSGEMTFTFLTDSLTVGNYIYAGGYDMFVLSYNGINEYLAYPGDSISFNITSYTKGHISGNFSGRLTPLVTPGNPDIFGTPGSALITKGTFKDVPVFY